MAPLDYNHHCRVHIDFQFGLVRPTTGLLESYEMLKGHVDRHKQSDSSVCFDFRNWYFWPIFEFLDYFLVLPEWSIMSWRLSSRPGLDPPELELESLRHAFGLAFALRSANFMLGPPTLTPKFVKGLWLLIRTENMLDHVDVASIFVSAQFSSFSSFLGEIRTGCVTRHCCMCWWWWGRETTRWWWSGLQSAERALCFAQRRQKKRCTRATKRRTDALWRSCSSQSFTSDHTVEQCYKPQWAWTLWNQAEFSTVQQRARCSASSHMAKTKSSRDECSSIFMLLAREVVDFVWLCLPAPSWWQMQNGGVISV